MRFTARPVCGSRAVAAHAHALPLPFTGCVTGYSSFQFYCIGATPRLPHLPGWLHVLAFSVCRYGCARCARVGWLRCGCGYAHGLYVTPFVGWIQFVLHRPLPRLLRLRYRFVVGSSPPFYGYGCCVTVVVVPRLHMPVTVVAHDSCYPFFGFFGLRLRFTFILRLRSRRFAGSRTYLTCRLVAVLRCVAVTVARFGSRFLLRCRFATRLRVRLRYIRSVTLLLPHTFTRLPVVGLIWLPRWVTLRPPHIGYGLPLPHIRLLPFAHLYAHTYPHTTRLVTAT